MNINTLNFGQVKISEYIEHVYFNKCIINKNL